MTATREQSYQMQLEYFQLDGTSVLEVALGEQDFARAIEAAFFEGLRRGRFTEYVPPHTETRVEPRLGPLTGPIAPVNGPNFDGVLLTGLRLGSRSLVGVAE